jgi:hypothetical protein
MKNGVLVKFKEEGVKASCFTDYFSYDFTLFEPGTRHFNIRIIC